MAGGLPHPVLWSTLTGMDYVTINGAHVEFKHVFYTWIAMAILFSFAFLLRGKVKMVPGKIQNVFEVIIGGLEEFVVSNIGEDGRKIFHVLIALFFFILFNNLLGLVPGCDAPTANVNTNAALALFTFAYYNWIGIKRWGVGYIKHFCGPFWWLIPLMLPLELISHAARPLSLTLRLFGNIRGEEIVLVLFFILAPIFGTIPIYFLFLLAKCLQAFIWFMLGMIYLKGSLEHAH
ncbi:F0F1 ATP synthase subunit A [Desulfovibrio subterraneus]|jgi:F-type H+-transporting ATPase subunit a|uniref:ATP synthase subunit a n=1 Tax=Desulfovibrio subterraneus TaxID=2718620 RepID=A0A7J0BE14_9BACT|nr:F0F1 ATP synthase subunit A [Desulfovibrio subterraneus]WBF68749.1 F0F1 ATP synthase subunit A [Desulfovibrio subterraneus]GFM31939.1 ATP synthase subunit a [Desulfovibrio subterraneus]